MKKGSPAIIGANIFVICISFLILAGCGDDNPSESDNGTVPHEGRWGIYALDLSSQDVALLYSNSNEITGINLSNSGTILAFCIKTQSEVDIDTTSEIHILEINGGVLTRLTENYYFDAYPSFSPDDEEIAFLTKRNGTLDIYVMNSNGSNQELLYNSGGHDADVNWGSSGRIAFTRDFQIWTMNYDGDDPQQVTDPPNAGQWGAANLPIGDYDPRISPDGSKIAFERMVDVSFVHGGYDIYVVSTVGSGETNLTSTGTQGYSQGFANWSHSGDKLVYILATIDEDGKFELHLMKADGSEKANITPGYFPPDFLCHNAVFSADDSKIYFIGQWWQ